MATDSSHMEKAQRICQSRSASQVHAAAKRLRKPTDLGWDVFVRKQDAEDGGTGQQILDLEGVKIGILSGLVIMQHEVDDVSRSSDEDQLEDGVI